MVYHVDSHVASCSMEIHMVNHEVGMRCAPSPILTEMLSSDNKQPIRQSPTTNQGKHMCITDNQP